MKLLPCTVKIDKVKVMEFAKAIGETDIAMLNGEKIPPTFATSLEMWGGLDFVELARLLGLRLEKMLHGEQEYNFVLPLEVGQFVTIQSEVVERFMKGNLAFVKLESLYSNQKGETLMTSKMTLIERN